MNFGLFLYGLSVVFMIVMLSCLTDSAKAEIRKRFPDYKGRRRRLSETLPAIIRITILVVMPLVNTFLSIMFFCEYEYVYEDLVRKIEEEIKGDIY